METLAVNSVGGCGCIGTYEGETEERACLLPVDHEGSCGWAGRRPAEDIANPLGVVNTPVEMAPRYRCASCGLGVIVLHDRVIRACPEECSHAPILADMSATVYGIASTSGG